MREHRRPHEAHITTEPRQTTVAALPPSGAPNILVTKFSPPHPGHTPLEPNLPIAPPDASDVRKPKNVPKTILDNKAPSLIHIHPHHCKTKTDELQISNKTPCTGLNTTPIGAIDNRSIKQQHSKQTPAPNTEGGPPKSLKRRATVSHAQSSYPHTISCLTDIMATCTDEQYSKIVQ